MTSPSGPADPPGTGSSQERLRGCLPRLDQSPVAREFVQDPYPFYAAARAQGDFFWWNDYDRVCASSHRAVNQLLRDRRWGREIPEWLRQPVPEHLRAFMDIEANSMLEIDPPRHTAAAQSRSPCLHPESHRCPCPVDQGTRRRDCRDPGQRRSRSLAEFRRSNSGDRHRSTARRSR